MSKGKEFPPRMVLKKNKDGIVEAVSLSFVFRPFPDKATEYLSETECDAKVEEARREGRAEGIEDACRSLEYVWEGCGSRMPDVLSRDLAGIRRHTAKGGKR